MFRNLTCLGIKHIKKSVTTKRLEKCLCSKHIFYSVQAFFRHITFDHSSSATGTGLYILVEEVTVNCFPIETFMLHGRLNAITKHCSRMLVKKNDKGNYNKNNLFFERLLKVFI